MMESSGILLDADVISHFMASGEQALLCKVFSNDLLMIVDQVYTEASYCPWDPLRKEKLDILIKDSHIFRLSFPQDLSSQVVDEYFRLKAENPRLGKGERACMSIARFHNDVIASSNFRDVASYCSVHNIVYLGFLDILWIAMKTNLLTEDAANAIVGNAIQYNGARFPVDNMAEYLPVKDLSRWVKAESL